MSFKYKKEKNLFIEIIQKDNTKSKTYIEINNLSFIYRKLKEGKTLTIKLVDFNK